MLKMSRIVVEIEKPIFVSWIRFKFYRNHDTRLSARPLQGQSPLQLSDEN